MKLKPDDLELLAKIIDTHIELMGDRIADFKRVEDCDNYLDTLIKEQAQLHAIRARIANALLMPIDTEIAIVIPNVREWN